MTTTFLENFHQGIQPHNHLDLDLSGKLICLKKGEKRLFKRPLKEIFDSMKIEMESFYNHFASIPKKTEHLESVSSDLIFLNKRYQKRVSSFSWKMRKVLHYILCLLKIVKTNYFKSYEEETKMAFTQFAVFLQNLKIRKSIPLPSVKAKEINPTLSSLETSEKDEICKLLKRNKENIGTTLNFLRFDEINGILVQMRKNEKDPCFERQVEYTLAERGVPLQFAGVFLQCLHNRLEKRSTAFKEFDKLIQTHLHDNKRVYA